MVYFCPESNLFAEENVNIYHENLFDNGSNVIFFMFKVFNFFFHTFGQTETGLT